MNCPRCNIVLTLSNRDGVEIDYCAQCRGVWLDRGELDKIIERANQFYGRRDDDDDDDDRRRYAPPPAHAGHPGDYRGHPPAPAPGYPPPPYPQQYPPQGYYKKKKSF